MHCFAVCSDTEVGKKRRNEDDEVQTFAHELRYPATTEASKLAAAVAAKHESGAMTVVFSTYHSIEVISRAQKDHLLADFDLIICDEAHRTTGATFSGQEESAFVRVHDQSFVRGHKRLYMTATPRIFGDDAKVTAGRLGATLASMDDPDLFGKELYCISFSAAVKAGLLCDYKVLVLAIDEAHVNRAAMELLKDKDQSIKVEDAGKIIGCWKALAKQGQRETLADDHHPMRRAVAFCQVIEAKQGGRVHKVSSKKIANIFSAVVEEYQRTTGDTSSLVCEASHVDGSMTATEKDKQLDWLKAETPDNTCRILSNVRCLSEGVDVPALDAVLFLTPRNSQIDVVQSVGRVMRRAPGKTRGYVVLPVVLPAGVSPELALQDNKSFAVVWQVLQALRSHDDRFDAMINRIDLAGEDPAKMEVIAVADIAPFKPLPQQRAANGIGTGGGQGDVESPPPQPQQTEMAFEVGAVERAIFAA
jgi:predicted helicase